MISFLAKKYWSLALLLIPLACSIPEPTTFKTVTFRVIPKSLPPSAKIYIAGNHSKLGNWQPNVAALRQQPDGSWSRSFSFHRGTQLEFKITRGNWESEAVSAEGLEFPNYVLEVEQDTTLIIAISHWRDTFKRATLLSAQRLHNKGGNLELLENWKYHAGDNPEWANAAYNDSAWEEVDPCLPPGQLPKSGWDGIGWFRLHLTVDSTLWKVPLAMYMVQTGASEVYLNGQLLYQYGKVGNRKEAETAWQDPNPKFIMFSEQTQQVLAVRYSNHITRWYSRLGIGAGFECQLGELNAYIADRAGRVRQSTVYQMFFTAAFAAFAFVHFLLFLFYPRAKENLLINFGWVRSLWETDIVYVYGILALAIAYSIRLSHDFAATHKNLEQQLVQVKELSAKTLEQERHAREEEIAKRLLEADNARKTQELEEARQLQLSMLPKEIPSLADLDIAVQTKTATEVGGDYYDFLVDQNGTLTVAIGDAIPPRQRFFRGYLFDHNIHCFKQTKVMRTKKVK